MHCPSLPSNFILFVLCMTAEEILPPTSIFSMVSTTWYPGLFSYFCAHSLSLFYIVFFSPIGMDIVIAYFLLPMSVNWTVTLSCHLDLSPQFFSSDDLQPVPGAYLHYGTKLLHSIHLFSVSAPLSGGKDLYLICFT